MILNYVKTPLRRVLNIDKIVSLHYYEYVKDFKGREEAHDFWELVYCDCGELEIVADGKKHVLRQGEIIFHKPNQSHNILALGVFASVFIVSYECLDAAVAFFEDKILTLDDTEKEIMAEIFREGKAAFEGPYDLIVQEQLIRKEVQRLGAEQLIKNHLEHLLIHIMRKYTEKPGEYEETIIPNNHNERELVDKIIAYLYDHIYERISLNELSYHLSFSKSHMERVFKEHVGRGIISYSIKLKIDEAKKLISENKYSFSEIAAMLHFCSLQHFSSAFKQYTSMSPTQYSKSVNSRLLR
jgi:AraC-like DNA-binding protein